jgi:CheY-like chemotaxis protein
MAMMTVLYVEDDPNDAVSFERALRKSGLPINLQIVMDGQFAIEYLLGQEQYHDRQKYPLPKVIVTDMKMYRMGGVQLLQWIRANAKFGKLPVVLYSTSNEDNDVSIAAAAGATRYFRKTYHCLEVMDFLRDFIANKGVVDAAKDAKGKTVKGQSPRPEK